MKFREYHLSQIINKFNSQHLPLDLFLSHYFRSNKAVGSKDRKFISESIYTTIRWKNLRDHLGIIDAPFDPLSHLEDEAIAPHLRFGFPEALYNRLLAEYGLERTQQICLASNERAPTTIRVNLLKISREALFEKWKDLYPISLCKRSSWGITFHQKINFFALEEFKQGLFEIQDEASQLIAQLLNPQPKEHVLDYCAGAGGKTLAFAPLMQNSGQIYVSDIRSSALVEARKRLNRAGVQNVQFRLPNYPVNAILVDAPCTGTGTYRRCPDQKWKFSEAMLSELVQKQREIFSEALSFLAPQGRIVYATCSILAEENEKQVEWFLKNHNLKTLQIFKTLPESGEMDGFFGALLFKT